MLMNDDEQAITLSGVCRWAKRRRTRMKQTLMVMFQTHTNTRHNKRTKPNCTENEPKWATMSDQSEFDGEKK
jgi:uncharacterized protein YdaU (DUF1376 family)